MLGLELEPVIGVERGSALDGRGDRTASMAAASAWAWYWQCSEAELPVLRPVQLFLFVIAPGPAPVNRGLSPTAGRELDNPCLLPPRVRPWREELLLCTALPPGMKNAPVLDKVRKCPFGECDPDPDGAGTLLVFLRDMLSGLYK